MKTKQFKAPAKINLCLHVLGRRLDGYHELAMAMQAVSLYDDIDITIGEGEAVSVCCGGVTLAAGEENIAARAARALLAHAGLRRKITIEITKRIPVAAGLGGGSSDAAQVLVGINEMLALGLDSSELEHIGAQLGADVPFFIKARPAWATGTGTTLEPLPSLPSVAYLLLNPEIAVSTALVYQNLQLTKGGRLANLPRFSVVTTDDLCAALHNDLEKVTAELQPEITDMKQALLDNGAMGALMSGSGATVFGIFDCFAEAQQVGEKLSQCHGWRAFAVEPVV